MGKTVKLNGRPYEVIGVFEKDPGLFGGPGVDQFVVIPLTNFRKHYPEIQGRVPGLFDRSAKPISSRSRTR